MCDLILSFFAREQELTPTLVNLHCTHNQFAHHFLPKIENLHDMTSRLKKVAPVVVLYVPVVQLCNLPLYQRRSHKFQSNWSNRRGSIFPSLTRSCRTLIIIEHDQIHPATTVIAALKFPFCRAGSSIRIRDTIDRATPLNSKDAPKAGTLLCTPAPRAPPPRAERARPWSRGARRAAVYTLAANLQPPSCGGRRAKRRVWRCFWWACQLACSPQSHAGFGSDLAWMQC